MRERRAVRSRLVSWIAQTSKRETTSAMQQRSVRFRFGESPALLVHLRVSPPNSAMFQVPMRRFLLGFLAGSAASWSRPSASRVSAFAVLAATGVGPRSGGMGSCPIAARVACFTRRVPSRDRGQEFDTICLGPAIADARCYERPFT